MKSMKIISVALPEVILKAMDDMVELEMFPNRSDVMRKAVEIGLNEEEQGQKTLKAFTKILDNARNRRQRP